MGTIQLGYLLICAGRGDDFGGHTRTLPVALGPVRARGRSTRPSPRRIWSRLSRKSSRSSRAASSRRRHTWSSRCPAPPRGPKLADQVADRVHAAHIQQEPGRALGDGKHACGRPGAYGLLAQPEQPGRTNRPDGAFLRQCDIRHCQESRAALVVFGSVLATSSTTSTRSNRLRRRLSSTAMVKASPFRLRCFRVWGNFSEPASDRYPRAWASAITGTQPRLVSAPAYGMRLRAVLPWRSARVLTDLIHHSA